MSKDINKLQGLRPKVATIDEWCLYDLGDDAILATGKFIEMEDLLDTWSGNVVVATTHAIDKYRKRAISRNNQ